jgi:putative peptidoglycan lipid II flippase
MSDEQRKLRPGADNSTPDGGQLDPPASPRRLGWQPRHAAPEPQPEPVPTQARSTAPVPPFRRPLPLRPGRPSTGPAAIAGDVVLDADVATSDLSIASAARLGGRAIALAGVVVVAGVVMSRLIGWVRTAVFLAEFGGGSKDLDSFYNAFRIPDTLFQLVAAGAIGSALVPVASALLDGGEVERARRLIATMANLMILALVPLAVVTWIAAPALVAVLLPTPDPAQLELRIGLTRVMLVSPVLLAVGAVMSAGLNSVGLFGSPAMAPNVYNVAIIVCAVALTPFLGIYALGLGVVVGAAGLVVTQATAVRRAGLYSPELHIHDPAVKETLLLMAPRALGLGATQIVFLVTTYFADTFKVDGALTWYNSAFTALQIPVGLIGVPLGIVLLPPLSRAVASGDNERFRRLVDQSLRLLLFVVVPLTGFMLVLATPTLTFLYQHGAFNAAATTSTTPIYEIFLLGLVAHVLIALLAPIFYAGKDTRTPVTAALLAVAVDVVAAAVLFPFMHLEGLALAIGLGAWAEVTLLVVLMERRIGFDLRPMARHSVAFAAGACVAAAAAFLVARFVEHSVGNATSFAIEFVELAAAGLVGVAVYVAWAWVFRLPELKAAIALARTLVGRRGSGGAPAIEPED